MIALLAVLKSSSFHVNDVLLQSSVIGCAIGLAVVSMIVLYFLVSEVLLKFVESVEIIEQNHVPPLPSKGLRRETWR